jgi:hypothetical protein
MTSQPFAVPAPLLFIDEQGGFYTNLKKVCDISWMYNQKDTCDAEEMDCRSRIGADD